MGRKNRKRSKKKPADPKGRSVLPDWSKKQGLRRQNLWDNKQKPGPVIDVSIEDYMKDKNSDNE